MRDTKLIAVVGKSASGKDTLVEELCRLYPGFHRVKRTTSRPKRQGEDGTYRFISKNSFKVKQARGDFAESRFFRGWGYGTDRSELLPLVPNIGSYDSKSLLSLKKSVEDLVVVYLDVPLSDRLARYQKRAGGKKSFEMYRRAISETIDYMHIERKLSGLNLFTIKNKRSAQYNASLVLDFLEANRLI